MTLALSSSARQVNDAELIVAIARGNLEALGELFERYEPPLRRYLGRLGTSPSDADDLLQNTFLEVARASPRFDPEQAARAWIFGVATMMVRRHRRSLSRAAARVARWAGLARQEPPRTPAEDHEDAVTARRIARALAGLAPKKREAFVLVTLEGLRGEEAAAALGVPVNTIWTRLHHARRELRAALGEEEP